MHLGALCWEFRVNVFYREGKYLVDFTALCSEKPGIVTFCGLGHSRNLFYDLHRIGMSGQRVYQ